MHGSYIPYIILDGIWIRKCFFWCKEYYWNLRNLNKICILANSIVSMLTSLFGEMYRGYGREFSCFLGNVYWQGREKEREEVRKRERQSKCMRQMLTFGVKGVFCTILGSIGPLWVNMAESSVLLGNLWDSVNMRETCIIGRKGNRSITHQYVLFC